MTAISPEIQSHTPTCKSLEAGYRARHTPFWPYRRAQPPRTGPRGAVRPVLDCPKKRTFRTVGMSRRTHCGRPRSREPRRRRRSSGATRSS